MRIPRVFFLILLLLAGLSSCRDESSSVGGTWATSAFQDIITDTCTVVLSTVLSDSLATSSDTITQIGRHADKLYGEIKTSFYVEYDQASYSFDETTTYKFDSITFKWYASGHYLGDTLTYQYVDLYPLMSRLSLEDDGHLYNKTNVEYNKNRYLGRIAIRPTPNSRNQKHELRLPDEWGKEWFNLMIKDDPIMENEEHFKAYFKGLAVLPADDGTCINGFQVNDSSFCITLYYSELVENPIEKTLVFKPNTTYNYTKVEWDRTGTPVASIRSGSENLLPSSQSAQQAYLQGLTGMYVDIDFPYLNNLKEQGRMVTIESAQLILYPVKGTYSGWYPLPRSLTLYTADQNNNLQNVITDIDGNSLQTGDLHEDYVQFQDTYYSFDLTSFIQGNFGTAGQSREKLQLFLTDTDFYNTLQGVVFADKNHSSNNNDDHATLKVYYKVYIE